MCEEAGACGEADWWTWRRERQVDTGSGAPTAGLRQPAGGCPSVRRGHCLPGPLHGPLP